MGSSQISVRSTYETNENTYASHEIWRPRPHGYTTPCDEVAAQAHVSEGPECAQHQRVDAYAVARGEAPFRPRREEPSHK